MTIIALAYSQKPDWLEHIISTLSTEYQLEHFTTQDKYVSRLADNLTALILVDGTQPDWVFWSATSKSSPATRRIPVFLLTETVDSEEALKTGVDLVVAPDDPKIAQLVTDFARVVSSDQLDCECQEALPPLAIEGFKKFNEGEFYKQHDLFEEQWVNTEGPVRDLYRAILQVGVAYYQILRGNHRGARKMLLRSVQWLALLPDECQGIDVKALKEDSYRVRAALEKLPEDEIDQFDKTLLKPLKLT